MTFSFFISGCAPGPESLPIMLTCHPPTAGSSRTWVKHALHRRRGETTIPVQGVIHDVMRRGTQTHGILITAPTCADCLVVGSEAIPYMKSGGPEPGL